MEVANTCDRFVAQHCIVQKPHLVSVVRISGKVCYHGLPACQPNGAQGLAQHLFRGRVYRMSRMSERFKTIYPPAFTEQGSVELAEELEQYSFNSLNSSEAMSSRHPGLAGSSQVSLA